MTGLRLAYGTVPPHSRYIQPLLVSRAAPAVICLWLTYYMWWGDPLPGGLAVHASVAVVLAWLCVRSLRLGVVITQTSVEVRGYLWGRRLPRSAIVEVTETPTLVWRSEQGRLRRTPVLSLMQSPRALSGINAAHRSRAAELQRLLDHRGRRKR